jgi:hypothetical protein
MGRDHAMEVIKKVSSLFKRGWYKVCAIALCLGTLFYVLYRVSKRVFSRRDKDDYDEQTAATVNSLYTQLGSLEANSNSLKERASASKRRTEELRKRFESIRSTD